MNVDEWLRELRDEPPGHHSFQDMETGETVSVRKDHLGRIRQVHGGGLLFRDERPRRRYPHPVYTRDYPWAVSYEYQMLMLDLLTMPRLAALREVASAIRFSGPDTSFVSYAGMTAYYRAVEAAARQARPGLLQGIHAIAVRHGLDVLPWGTGWLVKLLPRYIEEDAEELRVDTPKLPDPEPRPVRGQEAPRSAALLLYVGLSGAINDEDGRQAITPVIDLTVGQAGVARRVTRIRTAVDARGPATGGRRKRSSLANDPDGAAEVYHILNRAVRDATRRAARRNT